MTVLLPRLLRHEDLPGCSLVAATAELPLKGVTVRGHVDGRGVVWVITQTFSNPLSEPAEAVYTFPLPHNGAVNGMKMTLGDRVVEAEIKERGEARHEYREAAALGHTAALVEQQRAEIFTTHVGNIHPGESVSVVITIHCTTAIDGDEATLRLPMMVKKRYNPADLPDAENISTRRVQEPIKVETDVKITFEEAVRGLTCETFADAEINAQTVSINDDKALRSDIVLRWDVAREICTAKWTPDSPESDEGTVEVMIRSDHPNGKPSAKRAVSIVLDRSGSMGGQNILWARRIVEAIIAALRSDDLVHLLTFNTTIQAFEATMHGFVAADREARVAILRELQQVDADGGTHLVGAIDAAGAALGTLQSGEHERVVVILTDGAYGDEAEAMRMRQEQLTGARVITLAIGQDANGFLDALSADGTCIFLPAEHMVAEVAEKVVSRIGMTARRHARLLAAGISEQAPHISPDIYPGLVVRLSARMKRPVSGTTIEIVCDDGTFATIPVTVSTDSSITTRWASDRIKALDADLMATREKDTVSQLEKLITALSVKHRVLSKYTAWLAIDRSRTTDNVIVRTLVQPDYDLDDEPVVRRSAPPSLLRLRETPIDTPHYWAFSPARLDSATPQRNWVDFDAISLSSSDDALTTDATDSFTYLMTLIGIGQQIRELLDSKPLSADAIDEATKSVVKQLGSLPATKRVKKLLRAITKLLASAATAVDKGKEAKALAALTAVVEMVDQYTMKDSH